ncbi:cell adhesion molecule CEACAM1-like [Genypterus blacodes]|uniref:cell adhesion molecule CEACAM1-like n=1 Tax=Genypterus blacodes TaxID=154954 RepID=UPI003F76DAE6
MLTPSSTDLMEFSSVNLSCSSSGSSLSFRWLNSSSYITASEGVQITYADGGSTLTITRVTHNDQGPFVCHVSNAVSDQDSNAVNFSITFGPENVTLAISPVLQRYDEGSDISLSCSALSNPPAQFDWFVNDNVWSNTGPELRLENIQKNQSGTYRCSAYNSKTLRTEKSKPAIVTVVGKLG